MRRDPIIFIFNSPLSSGCDYVVQTMRIVARTHPVYGIALGDIVSLPKWILSRDHWVVRHHDGAMIVRPISIVPGIRYRFVRVVAYGITSVLVRLLIDLKHRAGRKILWFFEPFHLPLLLPLFFGYESIYDCVDYYPSFSPQARKEHNSVLRAATFIFANSPPLAKKLERTRNDTMCVPLGFAQELFTRASQSSCVMSKSNNVVGYIGSVSARIDFELLAPVVSKLAHIQFVFVGPKESDVFGRQDDAMKAFEGLLEHDNVMWIQQVAKREIPALLRQIDIGIIPYRTDLEFNKYSFPMKVMEYFYTGRQVIATDIASLRSYERAGLLRIAKTPQAMIQEIMTLSKGTRSHIRRRQKIVAESHAWSIKVAKILSQTLK